MEYIKNFEDFVNESLVNSSSDLQRYVERAADKAQSKGGNGVNISDYGTADLAGQLETYYASGRGDGNIYTDKTIKLFKQLIDSMVDDEIKNNQVDESAKTIRTKKDFEADIKETQEELRKNGERVTTAQAKKIVLATYKDNNVVVENLEEDVNEGAGTLKQKYEQLIKNLEKAKIPCNVKLQDSSIVIECGWDFPDRIFHKVSDAADAANLKDSEIEVCAEQSGGKILDSKRVNGGPKRY